VGDKLELTLRGRAPVTPHRRNDERFCAELTQLIDDGAHDLVNPVDATATSGNGYALAWTDPVSHPRPAKLLGNRGTNIPDLRSIEELAYWSPTRQLTALEDFESHGFPFRDGKTERRPDD